MKILLNKSIVLTLLLLFGLFGAITPQAHADYEFDHVLLDSSTVEANGILRYAIRIKNLGPTAVSNAMIINATPDGTFYLENNPNCSSPSPTDPGWKGFPSVNCMNITLAVGEEKIFEIHYGIESHMACQRIQNIAWANADGKVGDWVTYATIYCPFVVSKDDGEIEVKPNQELTYDLDIENTGTEDHPNQVVVDILPDSLTYNATRTVPAPEAVLPPLPTFDFPLAHFHTSDNSLGLNERWLISNLPGQPTTSPYVYFIVMPNGSVFKWDAINEEVIHPAVVETTPAFWHNPRIFVKALNKSERGQTIVWRLTLPAEGITLKLGADVNGDVSIGSSIINNVFLTRGDDTDVDIVKDPGPDCGEVDITTTQAAADTASVQLFALVKRVTRKISRAGKRRLAIKINKKADLLHTIIWEQVWSMNSTILTCEESDFCVNISNEESLNTTRTSAAGLQDLLKVSVKKLRKIRRNKKVGNRYLVQGEALSNLIRENLATIPREESICQ